MQTHSLISFKFSNFINSDLRSTTICSAFFAPQLVGHDLTIQSVAQTRLVLFRYLSVSGRDVERKFAQLGRASRIIDLDCFTWVSSEMGNQLYKSS